MTEFSCIELSEPDGSGTYDVFFIVGRPIEDKVEVVNDDHGVGLVIESTHLGGDYHVNAQGFAVLIQDNNDPRVGWFDDDGTWVAVSSIRFAS